MRDDLKSKFLFQMTGAEFLELQQNSTSQTTPFESITEVNSKENYVYGLRGLAQLFGCSIPTANRIKQSGKIDKAITQIGRKIIINADLALELAGQKNGGRK